MTKQEEIKEGVEQTIKDDVAGYIHLTEQDRKRISKSVIAYLHSQGVVIKVDGELPEKAMEYLLWRLTDMEVEVFLDLAGYVAVEPLIKD